MSIFEYSALTPTGKQIKGTIDAENIRAARQRLRTQGVFPSSIKEESPAGMSKAADISKYFQSDRVSLKSLAIMTRQLGTLVGSGIPLVESLQALSEQTQALTLKRIIVDIRESVQEGLSFAKALQKFPKAFPPLFINMVSAGEASGTLDTVLENMANYLETQLELRRKVSSALFYPALMLVFCFLVVMGLLAFVVPTIVEVFTRQGAVLPLPTRIMIGISDAILGYWHLMLALIIGSVMFIRWYYRQPWGRQKLDGLILKIPVFGSLLQRVSAARVANTLGVLLTSGVGLLEALEIAKNIIANVLIKKALDDAKDGVREGRSLAKELSRSGMFPLVLSQMIAVGERSGKLEQMLIRASHAFEREVDATLTGLTSLIEPLMIIGLGGIVLAIVGSILMPMLSLMDIIRM